MMEIISCRAEIGSKSAMLQYLHFHPAHHPQQRPSRQSKQLMSPSFPAHTHFPVKLNFLLPRCSKTRSANIHVYTHDTATAKPPPQRHAHDPISFPTDALPRVESNRAAALLFQLQLLVKPVQKPQLWQSRMTLRECILNRWGSGLICPSKRIISPRTEF